jgi:hypothetical protein
VDRRAHRRADGSDDRLFEEVQALRAEMRAGFAELRGELIAFHRQVTLIVAAFAVGLLGLLGAAQL